MTDLYDAEEFPVTSHHDLQRGNACDGSVTYPTQADTYRKCASLNPRRRLILLLGKHPTEMCELLHQEICMVRGFKDSLVGWFPIVRVLSLSERKVQ